MSSRALRRKMPIRCQGCRRSRLAGEMSEVAGRRLCPDCAGDKAHGRFSEARHKFAVQLKRLYGMSIEEYVRLHDAQGGRCAICDADHRGVRYYRLVVDHDHVTGRPRGLLCPTCNSALGLLKDNPDVIRKAADYLERTPVARLLADLNL